MRQAIMAGNWKMNKTPSETKSFMSEIQPHAEGVVAQIVLCVPASNLAAAKEALDVIGKKTKIALGAQNMHFEDNGAFTGEVSADSLIELGVEYVIVGHSERREYFAETDETVNRKVKKALEKGLKPIICVGENLHEKELGVTSEKVCAQTKAALYGLLHQEIKETVIAYEPIWAIGTGKTATTQDANNTIKEIRRTIREISGNVADDVRILYGGSMNPENVGALMATSDIDGGLIGGASLKVDSFSKMMNY